MGIALPTGVGWNAGYGVRLHDKLRADLKLAMVQKCEPLKTAVRQILAEFPKLTVPLILESGKKSSRPKKPEEISDEDVISVIQGLVKSEKATLELQKQTSSDYLTILETYLPQQAGQAEIEAWIRDNVDFAGFKNKMQAVGVVMKHFGKLADGNLVKQIIQGWSES